MDGWWTPLIVVAALLAAAWGWTMVYRPLLQVRRLVKDLAEGKVSAGFVARGALGLEQIIHQLDKISRRLQWLSSQTERDKYNLRTILGSVNEGVMVTDPEGRIRLVNRSFLEMFGLGEIPLGRTILETAKIPEVAEVAQAVEKTFEEAAGRSWG